MEKYPPTMNLISDVLTEYSEYKVHVFTSKNSSPYSNIKLSNGKIFRLGSVSKISLERYFSFLIYNFFGTLVLLITRPNIVLVYESFSILPAYIYSKIFPKKKIHIHYHEYVSLSEKEAASKYMKFLFKCEAKLLRKYTCSQTNEDRKELFLMDNVKLKKQNVFVFPNLPPKSWWKDFGQYKKPSDSSKIKLVYVGVLDAETMYLEEVLEWVRQHSNELELTLFSQDISLSAKKLISKFHSENIFLKSALEYNLLPKELIKHDIGLVLYKGHILNYIYNVPNKVFEYLDCGLKVLADEVNKSLVQLENNNVYQVSFQNLNQVNLKKFNQSYHQSENKRMIDSTNLLLSMLIVQ